MLPVLVGLQEFSCAVTDFRLLRFWERDTGKTLERVRARGPHRRRLR